MATKQSASRAVSTSTSPPSAPSARSFHMKPKRSWPGVPNMYSTMLVSIVTRPKSSATVVLVFRSWWPGSSTAAAAVVIAASVVSGGMSDSAPMAVVLPTPKPPETTILTGIGVGSEGADEPPPYLDTVSECGDTEHQPLQERGVGDEVPGGGPRADRQQLRGGQV